MDLALLVLRVVLGLLFVGHGSQKLFGAFGGPGLKGTADMFDAISLRPGHLHARAAGMAEVVGGVLLALGLLTPVGAAMVIAVMVAAIITVHLQKGIWNIDGGYEYDLVLIAAAFALAGVGPGGWSLDNALGIDWSSTGWALAALAAGVIGGIGAVMVGRMGATRESGHTPAHPA
jgi:putative oxidoreductase